MGPVRNVCNTSHISVSSWQACVATNPPHCLACNASQTKLPALFTYPVSAASACFGRIVRCQHDSSEARARLSYKYHFVARRSLSCVGSSEQELPLPFASFGIGRSAHCKLLHESENLRRLHLHARVRAREFARGACERFSTAFTRARSVHVLFPLERSFWKNAGCGSTRSGSTSSSGSAAPRRAEERSGQDLLRAS